MADTNYTTDDRSATLADTTLGTDKEPATKHDVTEGGIIGAVGGAIVGGLAGGPLGAIVGAVIGGAASAGAVDVVDKHDHDYARTVSGTHTDPMDDDATVNDHLQGTTVGTTGYTAMPTTDYAGVTTGAAQNFAAGTQTVDGEVVLPVVEEQLQVGKREVQSGGARIHTSVTETPVSESVTLHEEHVTVDRRPVDRAATDANISAFKEGTMDVTETNEVPVVSKTARVVEEVVVGKTATDRTETVSDSVRRTDVEVEELASGTGTTTVR